MKIEHLAIWVSDLETVKDFYIKYFGFSANKPYHNPKKQFTSYFLSSPTQEGARLELMHRVDIIDCPDKSLRGQMMGQAHFAISVGSKEQVNSLTEQLRSDGYTILSEPRTTGDGYYESAVADPEGNYVEITA